MEIRKCVYCGKEFKARKANSKYCSLECRRAYKNRTVKCHFCGKEFLVPLSKYNDYVNGTHKSIYCSKECQNKSQYNHETRHCVECGKPFVIWKSDPKKYCNRECYENHRSKKPKLEIKVCVVCGKSFETYYHSKICCSQECASIKLRKRVVTTCEYCGKIFERQEKEFTKNTHHFCSKDCMYKSMEWDLEDIELLRQYYRKIPTKDLQKRLSKEYSSKSINAKAIKLGLTIPRDWSDEEEKIILENYETKPFSDVMKLLPNRSEFAIKGKARKFGLLGFFYRTKLYSQEDIKFLQENYLNMTNEELANKINKEPYGVEQKLRILGLYRPREIKKSGYTDLVAYTRSRLAMWKQKVKEINNYTCCLTGSKSNIVVHHCHGFNLLFDETIELLNFPIYDNFQDYTDGQLNTFVEEFLDLQEYYHSYVCITEEIHKRFHSIYGYGDNTEDQWNEFVDNYKLQNIA